MRNKKVVFVAFMIAMIALIQNSPVLAVETPLYPVSGSDVDDRTFEIDGHLVADGFAAAITMDLPVDKEEGKHARVGFAVGLGDPWKKVTVLPEYKREWYTPYVKEMWLKVEGDGDYEPSVGAIVDNTGTGGTSTPDFWTVLTLVSWIFEAYQIVNFLKEVFQEPPRIEWKQELHSVKAIVRQSGQPQAGSPGLPRLQTASAWFGSYFKRDGWNTLTISAEAKIWAMHETVTESRYSRENIKVGTYSVSFEVSVYVGALTGDEIYRTSGTLSGTGATHTFSASSLSGAYTVVMVGNEAADFDLYAKWNSPPTYYNYDAISWSGYSSEYFTISGSGTLYTMVRSYRGSGNWRCNVVSGTPSANGGRKVGSLSGSGATATYSLSGTGAAWVYLAGPDSGDYDLYLKWNSPPTTTSYDVRGWTGWSQEICNAEGSGTLYYMVRSYRGSGQYTMLALIF